MVAKSSAAKNLPLPPRPSRSSPMIGDGVISAMTALDSVVSDVVGNEIWETPIIKAAVETLEKLSDLGSVVPFVAPAFIVLRFIISIEKAARDADAKCSDLLERITFMLSQLAVLRTVQVNDATKRVIERMNDVLKSAASLIQAYRKQSVLSRRLHTGNKEKFGSCVESISSCCTDLMISLQIYQTTQIDILTRSVPIDREDQLAQKFISEHGGDDDVRANPALVSQFAQELHLKVDDEVMEQISTNFTQLMQAGQAQLETALNESVSTAVIEGIKGLAAQMNEVDKEQVFKCVQCDQDYRNSRNGPTSCSFHRAEYSSWSQNYPCCSTSHPCQVRFHRSNHHCDYPYGPFFDRVRKISNYTDTVDEWTVASDINLETDHTSTTLVGQLLRWVTRGQRLEEPTIYLTVGTVWFSEPYFFDTFNVKQLEQAVQVASITKKTLIFRTSPSEAEYTMAEWVLSSQGIITGIRLTAKAATSDSPSVRICPIDTTTCTKSGEIIAVSEGGLRSYTPASPYILHETVRVTPELSDKTPRETRTDFKTRTSSALPVILKNLSDPPLKANPVAHTDWDIFEGVISVFNKHPAGTLNPITIDSVSASFRLIGDKLYTPVKTFKLLEPQFPITIEPRQSSTLRFQVHVPRSEEDAQLSLRWWNRAFVARHRPLRLKLTVHDIEEEEASLVLEYVFSPYPLEKPNESDLGFFYFDNPTLWDRYSIRVTKPSDAVVCINGINIDENRLKKVVFRSLKTGETEIDLGIGQEKGDGAWEWGAWALIDRSCQIVYAFKILLKQGNLSPKKTSGCLGYVRCPAYYETATDGQVRSVSYAAESVALPDLEPVPAQKWGDDDDVDDVVAPAIQPPSHTAPGAAPIAGHSDVQMAVSDAGLHQRLLSIDTNLSRIATAVEKLVEVLGKSSIASG